MVRDTLGRRKSHERQSTGKRINLTDRDILWLQTLATHGPLPTSYLLAFTQQLRHSQKRDQERLGDLFHETNTSHQGAYLDRPPQQFATLNAGYNQIVHAISKAGLKALHETDDSLLPQAHPGPWVHQHMVACTTASVELATLPRADVSYIPEQVILERAKTELRSSVETIDPDTKKTTRKDLIPDAIFGITYHTPAGDKFRFFVVEADRSTEPVTSRNWNRKSFERHLAQYKTYVADGAYKSHLSLTARLLVLNVVPDQNRLDLMLRHMKKKHQNSAYQLFQAFPDFAAPWKPPQPRRELLEFPWQRYGHSEFRIDIP